MRLIRNASWAPCTASAGSWRSIWATACWCISAIRRPTRTTLSVPYGRDWSWYAAPSVRSNYQRSAANPCRHSDRAGRRRRSDWIRRGTGARHRRRDAEPRGAPARDRGAQHRRHCRGHAQTSRQSVRTAGPRTKGAYQGHHRACAGLGGAAGEFSGRPVRGAARKRPDGAGRARRRTRIAAAPLGESKGR